MIIKKKEFSDDTPENTEQYTAMALSGSMNRALIPVMQRNFEMASRWQKLVSYINEKNFPITLHSETPMVPPEDLSPDELSDWYLTKQKSRFEQAFIDTHKGDIESFLAEFQFAFVRSLVRKTDEEALERWLHLIQAINNVGERSISENPELFPPLIDVVIEQFKVLPDNWLTSDSKIVTGAPNLIEDMIDTEIREVVEKAKEFSAYLESRGISI